MTGPVGSPLSIDFGSVVVGDRGSLQRDFAASGAVVLPNFLAQRLLDRVVGMLGDDSFSAPSLNPAGVISSEAGDSCGRALRMALRRPDVLGAIGDITGVTSLTDVSGVVLQSAVETGESLGWHDDLNEPRRRVALTIALSAEPYTGGDFTLQRHGVTTFEHHHATPGAAVLFAIGTDYRHRVTPIESGGPRRVFSGWFLE